MAGGMPNNWQHDSALPEDDLISIPLNTSLYPQRGTVQRDVNTTQVALHVPKDATTLRTLYEAVDFWLERIWLPMIANGRRRWNFRALVAVSARYCALESIRATMALGGKETQGRHCD